MLASILGKLLMSLGVLILCALFVVVFILAVTFIRLIWVSCDKAVQECKNNKEKH